MYHRTDKIKDESNALQLYWEMSGQDPKYIIGDHIIGGRDGSELSAYVDETNFRDYENYAFNLINGYDTTSKFLFGDRDNSIEGRLGEVEMGKTINVYNNQYFGHNIQNDQVGVKSSTLSVSNGNTTIIEETVANSGELFDKFKLNDWTGLGLDESVDYDMGWRFNCGDPLQDYIKNSTPVTDDGKFKISISNTTNESRNSNYELNIEGYLRPQIDHEFATEQNSIRVGFQVFTHENRPLLPLSMKTIESSIGINNINFGDFKEKKEQLLRRRVLGLYREHSDSDDNLWNIFATEALDGVDLGNIYKCDVLKANDGVVTAGDMLVEEPLMYYDGIKTVKVDADGGKCSIGGLKANTTYEIRFIAANKVGLSDITWTVDTKQSTTPTITTNDPSNIGYDSVKLNGTLDDDGGVERTVGFKYGVAGSGNWTDVVVPTPQHTGAFVSELTGLNQNTTYEYYAYVMDGSTEISGTHMKFQTGKFEMKNLFSALNNATGTVEYTVGHKIVNEQ